MSELGEGSVPLPHAKQQGHPSQGVNYRVQGDVQRGGAEGWVRGQGGREMKGGGRVEGAGVSKGE